MAIFSKQNNGYGDCFSYCSLFPLLRNTLSIPTMTSHVVDEAHLLTTEQRDSLARRLALFQQQTGSQIAILIVKSTSH